MATLEKYIYRGPGAGKGTIHQRLPSCPVDGNHDIVTWSLPLPNEGVTSEGIAISGWSWSGSREDFFKFFQPLPNVAQA